MTTVLSKGGVALIAKFAITNDKSLSIFFLDLAAMCLERARRKPLSYFAIRYATMNFIRWHVPADQTSCGNHCPFVDRHAGKNGRSRAKPGIVLYRNWPVGMVGVFLNVNHVLPTAIKDVVSP